MLDRICRASGLACVDQLEPGYPGSCAVFVVPGQLVVKIYPPMCHDDYRRELHVLPLLEEVLPAPQVLAAGVYPDRIDWPFLILSFCPGTPLRELASSLTPADYSHIAAALGRWLRSLHDLPLTDVAGMEATPSAWRALLHTRRDANLAALAESNLFSALLLSEIDAMLSDLSPLAPAEFQPHLVNADLTEDHLMLRPAGEGWELSAIIDWGDVQIGSPEYEWVALWLGAGRHEPSFFRQILAAYDPALRLDTAYRDRLTAMTLLHLFGPLMLAELAPPPVDTWAELRDWLWPIELEKG